MIISTTGQLQELCTRLSRDSFVALDTEFIREKTYYAELCLIQIAGPSAQACIDPLSPQLDLAPLFELLQNPNVTKVFHAARQDIEIFYHLTGQIPTPLFDTQIAAMVCGYRENIGYQELVQDLLGITLDKSMRITDWSRRPLTDDQVDYAMHDVTHLRDIYRILAQKLRDSCRQSWLADEIAVQNDPKTYEVDDDEAWQRIKIPFRRPVQVHVFARLCAWRERTAKEKNRPRKYILKDDALIELAGMMPTTPEQLRACRTVPKGFEKSTLGQEVLAQITRAQSDPPHLYPQSWDRPKSLSVTQKTMADLLHLLLMIISANLGIAPRLIASTDELHQLARGNNSVPCMTGWRRDVFGEKVLLFKQGLLFFTYNPHTHKPEIREKQTLSQ